ncbi:MAG TPA: tautomerase family protein [Chloroflexota bacterium]|nr:tautomerase family protein [Chloroflexota bacterium]
MRIYPGRTPEQKTAVVRGLTEVVVRELGVPPQSLEILLIEVPREHRAFGGTLAHRQPAAAASTTGAQ